MQEACGRYGQKTSEEQKLKTPTQKHIGSPVHQKLPFDTNRHTYAHPNLLPRSSLNDGLIDVWADMVRNDQKSKMQRRQYRRKYSPVHPKFALRHEFSKLRPSKAIRAIRIEFCIDWCIDSGWEEFGRRKNDRADTCHCYKKSPFDTSSHSCANPELWVQSPFNDGSIDV